MSDMITMQCTLIECKFLLATSRPYPNSAPILLFCPCFIIPQRFYTKKNDATPIIINKDKEYQ